MDNWISLQKNRNFVEDSYNDQRRQLLWLGILKDKISMDFLAKEDTDIKIKA